MASKQSLVVVGGGIVGASIAWHLAAEHGSRVAVTVVAAEIGGTATPNSFAWLNANFGNPRHYYEVRRRSIARWHALERAVPGLASEMRWTGNVQWDEPADELAASIAQHQSWGNDVTRVDGAAVAAREPWLADAALPDGGAGWAALIPGEGSVEATAAARLLLADAQRHGAVLVVDTVEQLADDGQRVTGVVTGSHGTLAGHVVLAAGLGTVPLCADVGVTVPVHGRAGMLVHSHPVAGPRLLNGLVISSGPHMRQTVDGRLLAGANFAGSDPGRDPDAEAAALFARVQAMFRPALPDGTALPPLTLDRYTVGVRPDPADGLPILGASGRAGLTLAVMHSGITLAALVGEKMAALVADGTTDDALQAFLLSRFDGTARL